jgi:D-alanyl-D-alanine carboxypeptidase (penicillin-binding protein 5/6)
MKIFAIVDANKQRSASQRLGTFKYNHLILNMLSIKMIARWMFIGCFVCGIGFLQKGESACLQCELSAPSAVLMNAETGKVLFAKNADVPCYPASTTKMATALYALHQKKDCLQQKIVASKEALMTVSPSVRKRSHPSYRLEFGGTHIGIKAGEELDYQTLLYGLMLSSGNDAANVIAEFISGSIPQFMQELNLFLQEIGCKNSRFQNPH